MRNLKLFLFGFLFMNLLVATSCSDDDDDSTQIEIKNIVDTAIDNADLSILVQAVQQAGLVSTLQSDGPFTVFAPTNAAFQDLLDSNPEWNSLSDIDNATLTSVLTFHVLAAKVEAGILSDSYVTTLSTGPNDEQIVLQVDVTGGVKFNGSALPVATDVQATNGVIHVIDKVMLPPNVVNLALNNPNFSTLVSALTRSDLSTDFVSILSGNGPFTIFAPTNQAFQNLLDSNEDWNSLNDIPTSVLEAVLSYHAIAGANVQSSQLSDNQVVSTLGGSITFDLSNGPKIETTSGQSVNIILPDVQGSNGVIHAIDTVLLP
jgi:uncharacterized surface protein with fasciclin (FAS1) repeats